jgi:predicted nucleotide-binding protein
LFNVRPLVDLTTLVQQVSKESTFVEQIMVNENDVFVVYGRDTRASEGMKQLLRAVSLTPVDWEEAVEWTGQASPMILDVIQTAFARVQAAVVLFTPDEFAELRKELQDTGDPEVDRWGFQPRPNVFIEAGMALALYRNRTLLVQIGQVRIPSDLHGMHFIRFDGSDKSRHTLITRLTNAGCKPRIAGGGHLTTGFDYLRNP